MPTIIILFVELQFTFGFKRWTKLVSVTSFCTRIVFLLLRFLQCNVTEECKYTCIIGYSSGELGCFSLPEPNARMNSARRLLLAWFTSSTTYQPVGFVVDFSVFFFFVFQYDLKYTYISCSFWINVLYITFADHKRGSMGVLHRNVWKTFRILWLKHI